MANEPVTGKWYEAENGDVLKVTSFDKPSGSIEIEYEDGAVDELDLDSWLELNAEEIESQDDDEDEDAEESADDEDADDDDDEDLDEEDLDDDDEDDR
jgi:TATA-binding protein-associated factor Taf7